MKKQSFFKIIFGFLIGLINGFLGAGGGMIAVPALKFSGFSEKEAHENAVAVILPLTVLSAGLYLWRGSVSLFDALPFIPAGLVGAVGGTFLMKKISNIWLTRIFGGFMIFSGIRMLF
ncbi:MAG: sulfite exporter TauE/SafE family protein [Clostridia bacterium]|nr:sulfite exporter TauE/SafE family protein [Clostridia bacterium]